jgi:hypothetical protein
MSNGNDFWILLVLGYLHLSSPPFMQALRTDEIRQELEAGEAGEGHISCPSGRPPGPELPRIMFSGRLVTIVPQVERPGAARC